MNRRTELKNILAGAAAEPLLCPATGGKPNVVLCKSDHQGCGDGSDNGPAYLKTPILDTMSAVGIRVSGIPEWPDRVKPGQSSLVSCRTSDYFATVLDVLGCRMRSQPEPIDDRMKERSPPIGFETTDNGDQGAAGRLDSPNLALMDDHYKFLSAWMKPARVMTCILT